jgi:hypothetical protein
MDGWMDALHPKRSGKISMFRWRRSLVKSSKGNSLFFCPSFAKNLT